MKYTEQLHPICSFLYFMLVILTSMLTTDPIVLSICFLSGVVLCGIIIGAKKLFQSLFYTLFLMALITLTNPIFVHKGATILFFMNDNPVTKEALVYGFFSSMMVASVFFWCRCYSEIMTSDKFIYLFGRVIPKLSLVLSMTLAFIPKMTRKFREIDEAQRALGIYSGESWTDKLRGKLRVMSILLTNCLESGVDTANSMRARGYGLFGRTSFAVYRFNASDAIYLALTAVFGVSTLYFIFSGKADFSFYPVIGKIELSPSAMIMYISLFLLAGLSIFMEVKENILWHFLKSKI